MNWPRHTALAFLAGLALALPAVAQDSIPDPAKRQVYYGEQHLHTQDSPDAFMMGTRNTPDDAYNFCKGEPFKKSTSGEVIQKATPYDWCAVTDRAEYLGMMPLPLDPESILRDTPIGEGLCGRCAHGR